jgi:hypothetical protein
MIGGAAAPPAARQRGSHPLYAFARKKSNITAARRPWPTNDGWQNGFTGFDLVRLKTPTPLTAMSTPHRRLFWKSPIILDVGESAEMKADRFS